jgi:DNA-directed RNA polymerase sigma subunit (sigma70/sigma32)
VNRPQRGGRSLHKYQPEVSRAAPGLRSQILPNQDVRVSLDSAEIPSLLERSRAGDTEAREQLILGKIGLVITIADHRWPIDRLPLEEAVSYGLEGLLDWVDGRAKDLSGAIGRAMARAARRDRAAAGYGMLAWTGGTAGIAQWQMRRLRRVSSFCNRYDPVAECPSIVLERAEILARLRAAYAALTEADRRILSRRHGLHGTEPLPIGAIALAERIKPEEVERRLVRAESLLRSAVGEPDERMATDAG